jgi:DNA primase
MDLFNEVKRRVTMRQLADKYGFEVDRKGWIVCPLHNDHHPSLKLYPNDRGWYCFACAQGGSVIDFVCHVFGLKPAEAAKKINEDFSLGISEPLGKMQRMRAEHERLMMQKLREKQRCEELYKEERELAMIDEYNWLKSAYSNLPPSQRGVAVGMMEEINYKILEE